MAGISTYKTALGTQALGMVLEGALIQRTTE